MAASHERCNNRTTILIAHGSRNPAAQQAHEALVAAVGTAAGVDGNDGALRAAYLEMADPDITSAIDAAVADGATEIRLLPCFLHPGNHVEVDIPAIANEARAKHSGTTIEVMAHLGSNEALVDLLAEMVSTR